MENCLITARVNGSSLLVAIRLTSSSDPRLPPNTVSVWNKVAFLYL